MKKIISIVLSLLLFTITAISAHEHHGKDGKGKGVHFKKMDTDGDNKVSKDEWQKYHDAHFTELDKDADGSVTMEEMKAFHDQKKSEMKESKKEVKRSGKK